MNMKIVKCEKSHTDSRKESGRINNISLGTQMTMAWYKKYRIVVVLANDAVYRQLNFIINSILIRELPA